MNQLYEQTLFSLPYMETRELLYPALKREIHDKQTVVSTDMTDRTMRYINDILHSDFGPAIIWVSLGIKTYIYKGRVHREDGPACTHSNNGRVIREEYLRHGKLDRNDGPALIQYHSDGTVLNEQYWRNGEKDRENGPAETWYNEDGSIEKEIYYRRGLLDREDGPAVIWKGKVKYEEHWLKGKWIHPDEYKKGKKD